MLKQIIFAAVLSTGTFSQAAIHAVCGDKNIMAFELNDLSDSPTVKTIIDNQVVQEQPAMSNASGDVIEFFPLSEESDGSYFQIKITSSSQASATMLDSSGKQASGTETTQCEVLQYKK